MSGIYPRLEVRCSRDLALKLGAIWPQTTAHHQALRERGDMLVIRDRETGWPLWWAWQEGALNAPSS